MTTQTSLTPAQLAVHTTSERQLATWAILNAGDSLHLPTGTPTVDVDDVDQVRADEHVVEIWPIAAAMGSELGARRLAVCLTSDPPRCAIVRV